MNKIGQLTLLAKKMRRTLLETSFGCGEPSHIGGGLSIVDILAVLYNNILNINLGTKLLEKDVKSISIYDLKGTEIFHSDTFKSSIDTKKFNRGSYIIKIIISNSSMTKRFFVN